MTDDPELNRLLIMPAATGRWSADNALGHAHADALLVYMRRERLPIALGSLVQRVVEAGTYGGVEVGFFHRLAERVVS